MKQQERLKDLLNENLDLQPKLKDRNKVRTNE